MAREAVEALEKVEKHIHQCSVLSELLNDRTIGVEIDYSKYRRRGYCDEDINVGLELINIYLLLREYGSKAEG